MSTACSRCARALLKALEPLGDQSIPVECRVKMLPPAIELLKDYHERSEEEVLQKVMALLVQSDHQICLPIVQQFADSWQLSLPHATFRIGIQAAIKSTDVEVKKFALRYLDDATCLIEQLPGETDPEIVAAMADAIGRTAMSEAVIAIGQMIETQPPISVEILESLLKRGLYRLAIHATTTKAATAILKDIAKSADKPWGEQGRQLATDVLSDVIDALTND
jgi:hypothetical protein